MLTLVLGVTLREAKPKQDTSERPSWITVDVNYAKEALKSLQQTRKEFEQTHWYVARYAFPITGSQFVNQRFELVILSTHRDKARFKNHPLLCSETT